MLIPISPLKQKLREQIAKDIAEFIATGGNVVEIDYGVQSEQAEEKINNRIWGFSDEN